MERVSGRATGWRCRGVVLSLGKPLIMGILNVTPDSFSDGGLYGTQDRAVEHGLAMARDGASIIDVGGESTRPGAAPVGEAEELRRVIPVVGELASRGLVVSVDTSRASVMRAALDAGAAILNDVRGFEMPGALEEAAGSGAGLVVMHGYRAAAEDRKAVGEGAIAPRVEAYLRSRERALVESGAGQDTICWDPGFGFGKTDRQNFELLAATRRFALMGRPFLMALSRKSTLGRATGEEIAARRLGSSVAGAVAAVERGAGIVRVHDVRETRDALRVLELVEQEERRSPPWE